MNDILTKQAVKISLVDEGEAKKRTGKVRAGSIFNPFLRWGGGRQRVYLEALQQGFQLAAATFCQRLSHLHLLP